MPSKILIVEDDEFTRHALAVVLRRHGFTVITAEDGEQGLKWAKTERPDLIVCDLVMPNVNGVEMIKELRGLPECSDVPILVLTASGGGPIADAMNAGANYAMDKPTQFNLFIEAIRKMLK